MFVCRTQPEVSEKAVRCLQLAPFHSQALEQLGAMGPDARAAVPVLLEMAKRPVTDAGVRARVMQALGQIDPAAARDAQRP